MRTLLLIVFAMLPTQFLAADEPNTVADREQEFTREIAPLLQKYCVRCHGSKKPKGEFDLSGYKTAAQIRQGRDAWRKAIHVIKEDEMPPEEPLPTKPERQRLVDWLNTTTAIDWSKVKHPGHETIPRLTRDEYNNTMRDLFGVDLNAGEQLSQDGEGRSGFNTDRDSLFVTPAQMEKYLTAAEKTIGNFIALKNGPQELHFESENMFMTETKEVPKEFGDDFKGYLLNRGQMTLYDSLAFPADGIYEFKVRARSSAGRTGSRLRINDAFVGDIVVPDAQPDVFTIRAFVRQGTHQMAWNIQVPSPAQVEQELKQRAARKAKQNTAAKTNTETIKVAKTKEESLADKAAKSQQPARPTVPPKRYTKLPKNINSLVTRGGMANSAKLPVEKSYSAKAKSLVANVNGAAYSLQRPYEWLRHLGVNGHPSEIVRFKGYIVDRTKTLESAKSNLAKGLKLSREDFDKLFSKHNSEREQDNQQLWAAVAKITAKSIPKTTKRKNNKKPTAKNNKPGSVAIDWIKVRGPLPASAAFDPSIVFVAQPSPGVSPTVAARSILERFAYRAFRRPVSAAEIDRFMKLFEVSKQQSNSFDDSIQLALTGILVSPHFLFRVELGPSDEEFALNDYQLASRLSYFLWMSMPDNELLVLAEEGRLRTPETLRQQVRRMIADPKSQAFAEAFTGQWLGFGSLGKNVKPDGKKFPQFTPALTQAMKMETVLTFQSIVQDNRSLLQLLDSKQTWLNESLAKHYGIRGVVGEKMQRVTLTEPNRGGVLGMASVLTATSSATRTSPVIRGKWVLETLLGKELPEPPADAGELPGNAGEARTLREELLNHRRNPACATCHNKIDPIGFGLENFDAIGRFRSQQAGKKIDARGEFPDGTTFNGPSELKRYLIDKRQDEFIEHVSRRAMSFALGRELHYFDEPAIQNIVAKVKATNLSSQALLEAIATSYPFQFQTGTPPKVLD